MSLVVPAQVLKATESSALASLRDFSHGQAIDVAINFGLLEQVDLDDIRRVCKSIPGVGKTLTAEVYAEITERPLYSIRTGSLGTDPVAIESNLTTIFARGKKWGCVLLLDEADVFVTQRGLNIQQNAMNYAARGLPALAGSGIAASTL